MNLATIFKQRHAKKFAALGLFVILFSIFGDPLVYFAKSIHGQVVDESTGQPLEGVVLVAEWILMSEGFGGDHVARLATIESVTGKDGGYDIQGWGPRIRSPLTYLDHLSPRLTVYKVGYYPKELTNELRSPETHDRSSIRVSDWNGKTIPLKRFDGDWVRLSRALRSSWSGVGGVCRRECPRFLLELLEVSSMLKEQMKHNRNALPVLSADELSDELRSLLAETQHGK